MLMLGVVNIIYYWQLFSYINDQSMSCVDNTRPIDYPWYLSFGILGNLMNNISIVI